MQIPIVLASDKNYAPYMATAIQSVMENANKENEYIFIILHKNLNEEIVERLKDQVAKYSYFSIKFINLSKEFENFSLNIGQVGEWTMEAYFRLITPWLLKEFDKIIYMDCDIICNTDISNIYSIYIKDNLIAGAPDVPQISINNNPKYKGNFKSSVIEKIDNPENYINTGFIIMNLIEFRNRFNWDYLLNLLKNYEYKLPDQDLLNYIAKKSIFIFSQEFNFLNTNWDISHAPKKLIEEYCKARENPKIIHYTTSKPWQFELNPPFFHLFWKYATRTPFIETIISNMKEKNLIGQRARSFFIKVLKGKLTGK